MKTKLTIFIVLTVQLTAFGQQYFGIKVNEGLSYYTMRVKTNPPQDLTQEFYPMLSGQGGLIYNYSFKNNFLIGTEFLIMQIQGKEYLKIPFSSIPGNQTNEYMESNIFRHIYYLGIPVYFGYSYKKWNVNLGFQTNLGLLSGGREKGQAYYNGELSTFENKDDELIFNKLDYGIRIGLFYKLSEKFSIETNYYYGLTNLNKDETFDGSIMWNIQQLTFGLRYNLLIPKRKTGETENK